MASVEVRGVRKSFGAFPVLHGIDLMIEPGDFTVIVGPSGCGKSTLLRLIAGLEDASGGDIVIDGDVVNNVAPGGRDIAMVFQNYALYPHMTAAQNMAFGLENTRVPKDEIRRRVAAAAETLRIQPLLDRKPREMSGGQRQRVAIGRAIVRDPKVFLFDEPLSNLDAALRVQMRIELAKLHHQLKSTMIYVTHDQVEAMTMADRIVVMNEGRMEQAGRPLELYHAPRNTFVAGFIGSPKINLLPGSVQAIGSEGVTIALSVGGTLAAQVVPGDLRPGNEVIVGVRPESLHQASGSEGFAARVDVIERLGNETVVYASLPTGETIIFQDRGAGSIGIGSTVRLSADPEHCHLFHKDGTALSRTEQALAAALKV
ncbi:sn-glycerol-3-phosphate ABC transporter ATP-binding protein UgpC [Microvirga aerilata]|uniref:Sn-glycerol-3-phosphate ABC transporter ATP-binding protein UgpC n=1 Tax=Microvirga aerilata TaxID=670292 RepID=A0A936ZAK3_9HYPH|nr:sn-glycerol-3-phosphate ABC transporter ATP-binding protein UgpC [Microvirga aerilata]MBL0404095.1 sn-glycerol-3-phosphate ABC transporter ATP-binding protein UgpC [Microvirga aerilata]